MKAVHSENSNGLKEVAEIYKNLSDIKRCIWVGNRDLLVASQEMERKAVNSDENAG